MVTPCRALALALALAAAGCGADEPPVATSSASTTAVRETTTTMPVTTTTTTTVVTTTTATPIEPLETALDRLGYWPGPVDGVVDGDTAHAVVALQKAAGLPRTGVVDDATDAALRAGVRPVVEPVTGRIAVIDLASQLLTIAHDGAVLAILDVSTGRRAGATPTGEFRVTREIDGFRRSALGLLYRPKYFNRGIAIHGYTDVPPEPASHGCVRVTYAAIDHVWAEDLLPIGTPVVVR